MLLGTVYIHVQREATRRWGKAIEGHGIRWKHMETYGSLWKTRDQSIDMLCKRWAKRPRVMDRKGKWKQNRKGKVR